MLYLPVVIFGLAAAGGATLVVLKNSGKGMPFSLAIGHGALAVTGLVTLLINVMRNNSMTLMNISAWMFVAVAAGGLAAFSFHVRKKRTPDALIIVHALGAVASYVVLIISVFI